MGSSSLLFPTKTCAFASVAFRAGIVSLSVEWSYATEGAKKFSKGVTLLTYSVGRPLPFFGSWIYSAPPGPYMDCISVRLPFLTSSILSSVIFTSRHIIRPHTDGDVDSVVK